MKKTSKYNRFNGGFNELIREVKAKNLPKSKFYRDNLIDFINKKGEIIGTYIGKNKISLNNKAVDFVLLRNVYVVNVEHQRVDSIKIDHIWLQTNAKYIKLKTNQKIKCIGQFYEYPSHNKRNIGFKLNYAKELNTNG